jgi:hypothetical protein
MNRIITVFHYTDGFQGANPNPEKLFNGYVNTFLKIKIEASGYPPGIVSEEDKTRYIKEILDTEGIELDRDQIVYNAALRTLAKLFLNSLYG